MLQEIPGHGREGGLEGDVGPGILGCLLRNTDLHSLVMGQTRSVQVDL